MNDLLERARTASWSPKTHKLVVDLISEIERLSKENYLLKAREDKLVTVLHEPVSDLEFADRPSEAGRIKNIVNEITSNGATNE